MTDAVLQGVRLHDWPSEMTMTTPTGHGYTLSHISHQPAPENNSAVSSIAYFFVS